MRHTSRDCEEGRVTVVPWAPWTGGSSGIGLGFGSAASSAGAAATTGPTDVQATSAGTAATCEGKQGAERRA